MSDLERDWDDLPVGEAPVDDVLRAGRRELARTDHRTGVRRSLTRVAVAGGVAAAFVAGLLVDGTDGGPGGSEPGVAGPGAGMTPVAFHGELQAAESCRALLDQYVERGLDLVGPYGWGGAGPVPLNAIRAQGDVMPELGATPRSAGAANRTNGPTTQRSTSSETGTNVQEAGVDEPDHVKTDGELLVRVREGELTTYDVSGKRVTEAASLPLDDLHGAELLLAGDTVVAIGHDGTRPVWTSQGGRTVPQTRVFTVDVADPASPQVTSTVDYDTGLVAARQHGETVRLVLGGGLPGLDFVRPGGKVGEQAALERNRELVRESGIDDWLPHVRVAGQDTRRAVGCERVAVPRDDVPLGTTTVVGFDAARPGEPESMGIAGDASISYASTDHLYLAASPRQPTCWGRWGGCGRPSADQGTTHLYAFALDGTAATYLAAGEVEGTVADRWSMDEHRGVLRVAVGPSSETGNFNSVVTMRPRGDELVEIGRLDGLGRNEDIYSVRWFDDLALLVTFRRVDPFYAVDLSSQQQPELMGELKIPGFSDYLHPLGRRRVVGIGMGPQPDGQPGAERARPGGRSWGGQVGLFDTTDLTDPRRLDVVSYGARSRTLAGDDPRQVTWLPSRRQLLTVVQRGRAVYVSVLQLGDGRVRNTMTRVEYGSDARVVRTVPVRDRVALVTGEDVRFFDVSPA